MSNLIVSASCHISIQSNEPLSAGKSCRNRPIIAYTRICCTGTSFCLKVLQPFPRSHPNATPSMLLFFSTNISLCSNDLNAWDRLKMRRQRVFEGSSNALTDTSERFFHYIHHQVELLHIDLAKGHAISLPLNWINRLK